MNLDGDIFDPNGTLTGGYVDPGQSILLKQEDYKKISQQIEEMRKEQRIYEDKVTKLRKDFEYLANLKSDLETKTLKLNFLKEKLKMNSNAKLQDKHAALENELAGYGEQVEKLSEMEKKYSREIDELRQEKMSLNSSASKNKDINQVWKERAKKLEGEISKLNEEISGLKKVIYKSEVDRENTDADVKRLEGELSKSEKGYEDLKKNYSEKKRVMQAIKKDFESLLVFILLILFVILF